MAVNGGRETAGVTTALLLKLIGLAMPLRSHGRDEAIGMDITQHGEEAYTHGEGAVLLVQGATTPESQP